MNESQICTLDQVRAFLTGTLAVEFKALGNDAARYRYVSEVLLRLGYHRLRRTERGLVLR